MAIDDIVQEEVFTASKDELLRAKTIIEDYLEHLTNNTNDDRFTRLEEEKEEEEIDDEEE